MRRHRLTAAILFCIGCTNEGSGLTSFTAGPDDTGTTGPDIHGDPVPTTTVTDDADDGQPPGDSTGGGGNSTGVEPDGSGSGPSNDDATGELPPGVIAQGELY